MVYYSFPRRKKSLITFKQPINLGLNLFIIVNSEMVYIRSD